MYGQQRLLLFLLAILSLGRDAFATHNRAGEITYEQIDELTIRATITTYTRTSSFAADRDSLELSWGDGTSTTITRANGSGTELPNDIKVNFYIAEHTYPPRGTFKLSMMDPNRIAGILNIDFPNSVNIPFFLETEFTLLDVRFQGRNSSAILLQPPIDFACVNEKFTHNPNAYDPDGDSLSYELITPFEDLGVEVPNYLLPDSIVPGDDNIVSLDPVTGDFVWDSPKLVGEFNITFRINEYREGTLINSLIRDMQILVRSCRNENTAPTVMTIDEICVVAGEMIQFEVVATDPDSGQLLKLTALGGPFEVEKSVAEFNITEGRRPSPLKGTFIWQTDCSHIQEEFYQVVFKAEDDFFDAQSGLAALKSVRIKIVGPPPEDFLAEKAGSNVRISWASPYACENDDLFRGFSVWRRLGSHEVALDTCKPGLEGQGYEKIVFLTNDKEGQRYVAFDAELEESGIFCYRVVGEYALLTDAGNPFNRVQSLRSEESCLRFDRRNPLITKASVLSTDLSDGSILINWVLSDPDDVDTILNPGPYRIDLVRTDGFSTSGFSLVQGASFTALTFGALSDTSFTDTKQNTATQPYTYEVEFFTGASPNPFSSSDMASTVFLMADSNDGIINLSWEHHVSWDNFAYIVYALNDTGGFDTLYTGSEQAFRVEGLVNGIEKCYVVESFGRYGIREIAEPITNFSQIVCATPVDFAPPCPPRITVSNICNEPGEGGSIALINTILWSFGAGCGQAPDLMAFRIYNAPGPSDPLVAIDRIDDNDTRYDHFLDNSLTGCYAVTAIDSSGNESEFSNIVCVDNCPSYILANAFTRNNDQANDLFVPRVNRFIERIEMEIYNRWGQLVYETTDPVINWDGTNKGGKDLAEGTYYYVCKVFENRVSGIEEQSEPLRGYIQLIRGN